MTRLIHRTALAGALLLACTPVLAEDDRPPAGSMSPNAVLDLLAERGFRNFDDIEFDDGVYDVDAYDPRRGEDVDIKIDPNSGEILEIDD